MSTLLLFATLMLAYSNGANDNFKGVASLYGSKTASYRAAVNWATVTTFAGSLSAIFVAQSLLRAFSGRGVVPGRIANSEGFLLAIALGAGLTVIAATRFGFPVSTTHALTGAILGSGLMASASEVKIGALGSGFVLPLLLSPILAVVLASSLYVAFRFLRIRFGIGKEWCVCIGESQHSVPIAQPTSALSWTQSAPSRIDLHFGTPNECRQRYSGHFLGVESQRVMDGLHFLSAGVVCYSRGLNDTPKIAALLLGIRALNIHFGLGAIALAMALGGILSAARVAETMSTKITAMNPGQGFAANLATGTLVILASLFGLPVSTTHVSVGALAGIGWTSGGANTGVLRNIALSWILILPCAGICSALVWWAARSLYGQAL